MFVPLLMKVIHNKVSPTRHCFYQLGVNEDISKWHRNALISFRLFCSIYNAVSSVSYVCAIHVVCSWKLFTIKLLSQDIVFISLEFQKDILKCHKNALLFLNFFYSNYNTVPSVSFVCSIQVLCSRK